VTKGYEVMSGKFYKKAVQEGNIMEAKKQLSPEKKLPKQPGNNSPGQI